MIDMHTHVIPGVDDGAPSLDAAIAMLRQAEADGTKVVVATPHQRHPAGYDVTPEAARERLTDLSRAARAAGLGLELRLAAEVHFVEEVLPGLRSGRLLRLSAEGHWFLLELPVTFIPPHLEEAVFAFQTAGYFPVLAHPERNFEIIERPEIARRLRDRGVPLQVTAQSVTGGFGRGAEKAAKRLLKWGVVDVIASDAHHPERRPALLSAAVKAAAKIVGRERAEAMVTTEPARLLSGARGR